MCTEDKTLEQVSPSSYFGYNISFEYDKDTTNKDINFNQDEGLKKLWDKGRKETYFTNK